MPASSCVRDLYPALKSMSDDTLAIQSFVAESYLERLLGIKISAGETVENFDGQGQTVLILTNSPVTAIPKIEINRNGVITEYLDGDGFYQWDSTGRVVLQNVGFVEHLPSWEAGLFNIRVTYSYSGLSQSEQDYLIGGIMHWQSSQTNINPVLYQERIGQYSYMSNGGSAKTIPPFVASLVAPYMSLRAV